MPAQEAGEEVAYSILLDITRSKQAEEELRLSLERHNIITNQTNDIIFEWDIQKDELFFSSNWEKQYGYPPIQRHVRTEILKASHLHPDDIPVFTGLMDAMTAGVPYKEPEFHRRRGGEIPLAPGPGHRPVRCGRQAVQSGGGDAGYRFPETDLGGAGGPGDAGRADRPL